MLAFESGGLVPLDLHQFSVIYAHVLSVLNRAMETKAEKGKRTWAGLERARKEATQ